MRPGLIKALIFADVQHPGNCVCKCPLYVLTLVDSGANCAANGCEDYTQAECEAEAAGSAGGKGSPWLPPTARQYGLLLRATQAAVELAHRGREAAK